MENLRYIKMITVGISNNLGIELKQVVTIELRFHWKSLPPLQNYKTVVLFVKIGKLLFAFVIITF